MKKSEAELVSLIEDARKQVTVGSTYRHYKGNDYKVIDLAILTEDDGVVVIYEALNGEHVVFVRPLSSWLEDVDVDGQRRPRFSKIAEA